MREKEADFGAAESVVDGIGMTVTVVDAVLRVTVVEVPGVDTIIPPQDVRMFEPHPHGARAEPVPPPPAHGALQVPPPPAHGAAQVLQPPAQGAAQVLQGGATVRVTGYGWYWVSVSYSTCVMICGMTVTVVRTVGRGQCPQPFRRQGSSSSQNVVHSQRVQVRVEKRCRRG